MKEMDRYIERLRRRAQPEVLPEPFRKLLGELAEPKVQWEIFKQEVRELLKAVPKGDRKMMQAVKAWVIDAARARANPGTYVRKISTPPMFRGREGWQPWSPEAMEAWWTVNERAVKEILREWARRRRS